MFVELLVLEIVLGAMLLGGIIAYGKSLGERLCLLATVPVAYLLSFLLAKCGVWDFIGGSIVSLLVNIPGMDAVFAGSAAVQTGLAAILSCIIRPFMTVVLFWLLLVLLRIIVPLILKRCKAERASFFRAEAGEPVWRKIVTCAVGVVGAYAICMLSFLPINFFGNLTGPAVEKAQDEKYAGTYVQEVVSTADTAILSAFGDSFGGKMQKFTGFGAILNASASSLSEVSLQGNNGKTVAFNGTELVQGLLSDGVDAMAVYEYSAAPDRHTVGDLAPVASILSHLSESEAILTIGSELLADVAPDTEEGEQELTGKLLEIVFSAYAEGDTAAIQNDLGALAALLDQLIVDFNDQRLDDEGLSDNLIAYLATEEDAYEIVSLIASLSVYQDVMNVLSEYGMNALCDVLEISHDSNEYYDKFFGDLHTVLSEERVQGIYYQDSVEGFIRYMIDNDLSVSECLKDNEDKNLADAYVSYERYIAQLKLLKDVFVDYHLDERDSQIFFVAEDGSLFVFQARNDKWFACEDESTLSQSALLGEIILAHFNELFDENIEYTITAEEIREFVGLYTAEHLRSLYPNLSEKCITDAAGLASMIVSSSAFAPDVIYREEIIANLKTDATASEENNRHLAAIVSTAATFVEKLGNDETKNPIFLVLENFSLVGRLMDELHHYELTADVPGDMLMAITQSSDFGDYFLSDSVAELVENVKNDVSTYEELFTSVQALYNIINQIVPV